jgi:hypothetical protein
MSGARVPNGQQTGQAWTDQRRERAFALWREGLSASQIAKDLGGCSRNAVIGIIHRGQAGARALPSSPPSGPIRAARVTKPKPAPAIRAQAKVFGETRVRPAFVFANPGSAFSPEPTPPLILKGKAFAPAAGLQAGSVDRAAFRLLRLARRRRDRGTAVLRPRMR